MLEEDFMMKGNTYKVVELVGSSKSSVEDAIQSAIKRAAKTIRNLDWFEVIETRGCIVKDKVTNYQVIIKVGFRIEEN